MAIFVLVTVPQSKATSLAKLILTKRLGACINIIKGVDSYFWWKEDIDKAKETLLIIKTREVCLVS
ncbi:MAG: divalent cation tolerance protein CutA [Candidatus Omnitrophica bacterium]|nr:divalent cation tolerance protein CutA [Candidatus Omnitrophota bacterium]